MTNFLSDRLPNTLSRSNCDRLTDNFNVGTDKDDRYKLKLSQSSRFYLSSLMISLLRFSTLNN